MGVEGHGIRLLSIHVDSLAVDSIAVDSPHTLMGPPHTPTHPLTSGPVTCAS